MIDDKYIYFLFGVALLVAWLVIYFLRPDMRLKLWRTSALGILAGPLAEFWYLHDYWSPPMFLELGPIAVDDILVGFCITGIGTTIYDLVFRTTMKYGPKRYEIAFVAFFIVGLAGLMFFSRYYDFNSMVVSSVGFLFFAAIMVSLRPDLLSVSLWSGVLTLAVVLPIYVLLFDFIAPNYWQAYNRFGGTAVDITLPGSSIPVLEATWYFTWGVLAGIGYEFAGGRRKAPRTATPAPAADVQA